MILQDAINNIEKGKIIFAERDSKDKKVTYKEILKESKIFLGYFQYKNIEPKHEMVMLVEDDKDFITAFWASVLGGIVAVPMSSKDNDNSKRKFLEVWNKLNNPYIISTKKELNNLIHYAEKMKVDIEEIRDRFVDIEDAKKFTKEGVNYVSKEEDIAVIQFSSGSTGDPKGLMLSHKNIIKNLEALVLGYKINHKDIILYWMPLVYDFGLIGCHILAIIYQLDQIILKTSDFLKDSSFWIRSVDKYGATILSSPNFGYKHVLDNINKEEINKCDLSKVRVIMNGGEIISPNLCKEFLGFFKSYNLNQCSMSPCYGLAEGTLMVTISQNKSEEIKSMAIDRKNIRIGSKVTCLENSSEALEIVAVGVAVKNVELRVVNNNGEVLKENIVGLIEIKGDCVTKGYYNDKEKTKRIKDKEGWLNTEDLGFINEGNVYIVGRAKDLIIVNGENFYANDLERGVKDKIKLEIGVVGIESKKNRGEDVVAFIEHKSTLEEFLLIERNVKRILNEEIGINLKCVIPVQEMPKTDSGKVQRFVLKQSYEEKSFSNVIGKLKKLKEEKSCKNTLDENFTDTEIKVSEIIGEVLNVKNMGLSDNLYDYGIDSLKSAKIIGKIEVNLDKHINIHEFLENPTIKNISSVLDGKESNKKENKIKVLDYKTFYKASSVQRRMYAIHKLYPESLAYNLPNMIIIEGDFKKEKVETVINNIIERHESFRTYFEEVNGEIVQKISDELKIKVPLVEKKKVLNEDKFIKYVTKDFVKPFDLNKLPLIRSTLGKVNDNKYILFLDFHHIIFDGASSKIFFNEFKSLYLSEELPRIQAQYKDYVYWDDEYIKNIKDKRDAFWKELFEDKSAVLTMPKDYVESTSDNFAGDIIKFQLNKNITKKIDELCKEYKVTSYIFFITVINIFLHKYSSQDDIVLGTVVDGRNNKDIDNLIGMFVNTVVLRNKIDENKNFREFLIDVGNNTLKVLENSDYHYEDIIKTLNLENDELYNVMLVYQNQKVEKIELKDLKLTPKKINSYSSQNDLVFEVYKEENNYKCEITFRINSFKAETIERMKNNLLNLIENVLEDINKPIVDLEIMYFMEKQVLLNQFNNTERVYPKDKSVQEIFQDQVKKTPDKIALVFKNKSLTYRKLNQKSNSLARVLRGKGVRKESVVAIMCDKSIEAIIGILAILKAGGAYAPVDPSYPKERIEYMLRNSQSMLLLRKSNKELDVDFRETIDLDDEELYEGNKSNLEVINKSDDLAYVIYTSGTTGKAKGVMCVHKNIIRLVKNTNYIEFSNNDKILQTGAMVFDASTFEVWGALLNGLELHLADKEDILIAKNLENIINKEQITILWLTSELYNQLAEENINIFKGLKYLLVGGDVISPKYINLVKNTWKNLKVINGYGPTENTTFSLTYEIDKEFKRSIPIGKPIANSTTYILDKNKKLMPIGAIGEIYLGGDGIARGYINNEEMTKEKFIDNPFKEGTKMYRSGDLGRWMTDGNIEFLGRRDHQIKIRGFRVELGEIENELLKIDGIKESVVLISEYKNSKYLCAYYVAEKKMSIEKIKSDLKKSLPKYMIPAQFIEMEKMPLTVNGKVDRRKLPEVDILENSKDFQAPQNATEIILEKIWCEVLGLERIGINDNFFDLWGQSLKATMVVSKIYKELNKEIQLKKLFEYPTIKSLSKYIVALDKNKKIKVENVKVNEHYKASSAQKRMYMLYELNRESIAYNIPMIFNFKGNISEEKLNNTFEKLIKRHEGLRTYFDNVDGEIVQRISDDYKVNFKISKETKKIEDVIKDFIKPFDLNKYPLYKGEIIQIKEEKYLLLNIHHIIADGLSINLLMQEFKALYDGESLEELTLQYKDFSGWQNKFLNSEDIKKQMNYWVKEFSNEVPVLDLPYDYERPLVKNFEGRAIEFNISDSLKKELKELTKNTNTTMHMVLFSALNLLLSKCSNSEDIVVGIPVAGRDHGDFQNIVGMFVNTVAVRSVPEGEKAYLDFLKEVREKCLNAYENADCQFEAIVEKLQIKRDSGRNPLFDVMFNYVDTVKDNEIKLKDSILTAYNMSKSYSISKFDLTLNVYETDNSLKFRIVYCTKLFKEKTIKKLSNYYVRILENIVGDSNIKIKDIDYLGEKEKAKLLYDFNDTEAYYDKGKTIHEVFKEHVKRIPDNIAVVYNDEKLTYKELDEKSNSLAHILRSRGVRENTFVGIMASKSLEMIISVFAVLKSGGAYIPMDIDYPDSRLIYMLNDSKCNMVLSNTDRIKKLDYSGQVIELRDKSLYESNVDNISNINTSEDLAYIIYTSGSTGRPKGVLIKHDGIINFKTAYKEHLNITDRDRAVQFASFSFDASVAEIVMMLLNGASLYVLSKEIINDYNKLVNYLNDNKITIAKFPPAYIVNLDSEKVKTLRIVMTAGSPTNWEIINKWGDKREYINAYGPTEGTIVATIWHYNKETSKVISIGKPINNTKIYILDKYLKMLPVGVKGEICIGGIGVSQGYLNREELTKEKFVDSPFEKNMKLYKTGDVGRYLPDGNIEFLGRIDNQVKIRGLRIELGEIESKILEQKDVEEVAVRVFEDNAKEKYICAYVVSSKDIKTFNLKEHLKESLPEYMVPNIFIQVEKMPLTVNGKIDNKALPKPSFKEKLRNYEDPRNETEKILGKVWSEILGLEKVGINENFFDLGGQSLKAIILKTKINEKFNKDIPLTDIFKFPTINSLSVLINDLKDCDSSLIEKVSEKEYYDSSSVQKRMYMLYELDKSSTAYNVPMIFEIRGNYNKEKLEKAFQKLVKRHETLRTYFTSINGEIIQKINKGFSVNLRTVEAKEDFEKEANEFIRPFDLNRYPLFRGEIIKDKEKNYLILDFHHIIVDGYSIDLLIKEFKDIYHGNILDNLDLQYKDFSNWHNKLLKSEKMREKEKFWLDILKDETPVLDLPYDFSRPKRQSFEGSNYTFKLNSTVTDKLRNIGKETGATMHMILLSALNILLSKISMKEDIVIGTPVSGRERVEFQNIAGMFVNTLVLRNKPSGDKVFLDFLGEVKNNAIKAYENEDYQFDTLVESLSVVKDESRNPIFDVMFNYVDTAKEEDVNLKDISLRKIKLESKISKFDLTLNASENFDELEFSIEYCIKLFKKETIKRISDFYLRILEVIGENRKISLREIEIISDKDKIKVLCEFNNTESYYEKNKTVHGIFEDVVTQVSNNSALIFKDKVLNYRELNEKANSLAHVLRKKGVKKGSLVSIMADRSLEMIISVLAVLKVGGAYVPMDIDYPDSRLMYILNDCKCEVVLYNTDRIKKLDYKGKIVDLRDESLYEGNISNLNNVNTGEDVAYVIYTSGSTGNPKGVLVKHDGIINFKTAYREHLKITGEDRIIQFASFSFDASVSEIVMTLLNGACLYVLEKEVINDYNKFIEYLNRNKITIATLPPAYISNLDSNKVKYLKTILTAGSSTNFNIVKNWSMGREYINAYGPTEATIGVSMWHFNNKNSKVIPIGKPINNVKIFILDKYLNMQPIGINGEICICGPGIAKGYLNRCKLTKEKFLDSPFEKNMKLYKTGDIGRYLPDGNIEYLGRMDNQVKVRGFRIELGEIESVILQEKYVKEAVVTVNEDKLHEKYIYAYIVYNKEEKEETLRAYLKEVLPEYMIPSYFITLDKMPLTVNGKVNVKALPKFESNINSKIYVHPRNMVEKRLLEEWQNITGISGIGVKDQYYNFGGTSLKAIQFVLKLSGEYNININHVFECKTIEELAKKVCFSNEGLIEKLNIFKGGEALDEVSATLDGYDDYILQNQVYKNIKGNSKKRYEEILINGGTGFLGVNILNEIFKNTDYNVSLIIRAESKEQAISRLKKVSLYHFHRNLYEEYKNRLTIYVGDLTKKFLGLKKEEYLQLSKNINCIINCAANVKHYGEYEGFYNINVKAVEAIIEFSKIGKKKDIHHISTVSVSMGTVKDRRRILFTEYDCDMGQEYENYYINTKLIGEKKLLEARKSNLNVNIYRVGNLVCNSNSGIFQENINDNAFYQRIKAYISLGIAIKSPRKILEFSFVDEVSKGFVTLFDKENISNEIFHLYNPNRISMIEFAQMLKKSNIRLELLKGNMYIEEIKRVYRNEKYKNHVNNLIIYSEVFSKKAKTEAIVVNDKTNMVLKEHGFAWKKVNEDNIKNMINYCRKVKFINM